MDPEKVLLTTTEAAERLRIGKSALYDLIRTRKLRSVKVGRRRLIPINAVAEVVELLAEETEAAA